MNPEDYLRLQKRHLKLQETLSQTMDQLNLALTILVRMRRRYPHILSECTTEKEIATLSKPTHIGSK